MSKVTAVVLNWNNYPDTRECILSLTKIGYESINIIVVDNGSDDKSGERINNEFPDIDLVFIDENLGFAGGMNVGIEKAVSSGAEYIWLLNNDVRICDDGIMQKLIRTMETNPDIGILTPLVAESPGSNSIWFKKGVIDWTTGDAIHEISKSKRNGKLIYNDYIPFCSALIRSSLFKSVGMLDERFFLYYEDLDYCLRVKNMGHLIATDLGVRIVHKGSSTTGGELRPIFSYYKYRNQLLFIQKHSDEFESFSVSAYSKNLMMPLLTRILNRKLLGASSMIRGIYDGLNGKQGRGPYP